ncbi:hypothetical protein GLOIN_2v1469707 [Rhizophagus irregularis DAOM 181602=DAOM 197198]|uniref:Crinkler family protein n=1 Tax=Rhizophagus irregularis (strain DAOM 181602 / DAOM 197198 / MUCL 43194) TaxID=747089 RepID=A0A2P4QZ14_RHIID|nr:hypothetical protein GLOIN_2v1469707 [Rhizophagus irregularis DAOM 181602=DAOM 197198]POG82845.1 hypothetical protein GLOIN_2v1469707 [Rhizophagus irregularis DAOM 181602=DAOM 197198]|eukprot:XP_025189711.1 hypothetical protein GLOIN_2v1469707 [Rhizophagus irregularis DAOM 181602=DAOM 197198]
MSSNVASSSAGVPVISLPTFEEVRGYNAVELNGFLKGRLGNIDNHIDTLAAGEVDGSIFFDLTYEGLKAHGISLGASTKIMKLINEYKGGYKRRKIDDEEEVKSDNYDNESLEKVWKAFKDATIDDNVLNLSNDASYLLGVDDYENPITTIFIRDCYLDLSKIIFESNRSRWRITGNPGIGKTFFGYYLLYIIAKANGTVIYHQHHRSPILFSEDKVYCNAREPMEFRGKTILVCSPQTTYYKTFDSLGINVRYMPVWSLAEIDICRDKIDIFKHLTKEEVLALHYKWGGIPRFVLFHALNYNSQKQLDSAIIEVENSIMYFVGETSSGNSAIHNLVHICTNVPLKEADQAEEVDQEEEAGQEEEARNIQNKGKGREIEGSSTSATLVNPTISADLATSIDSKLADKMSYYSEYILEFASDYVSEMVMNKLAEKHKQELLDFVNSSEDLNEFGSLRGTMFERLAHRKLLRGGKFKVRPIDLYFKRNDPFLVLNNMEKLLFSDIDDIGDATNTSGTTKYYIPTQKNNKSFDSFIPTNKFFQMTIAERHPIVKSGLEKYIRGITRPDEEISFYFVLPETRFATYREQSIHTTKKTVIKKKPAWFGRFKQYALELDLKIKDI